MQGLTSEEHPQVIVLVVPLPAQGHLNQLLHLSHLITSYGVSVHFVSSATHNRQAKLRLHGWNDSKTSTKIQFHDFQLPPYASPPPNIDLSIPFPKHFQPLFEASTHLRQPVYHLMKQLSVSYKRVIVVHDITMAYVVQDIKLILNAEAYTFIPISAFTMFLDSWDSIPKEQKPFKLHLKDFPKCIPTDPEWCMTREMLDFTLKQVRLLGFESGWLYNTSRVIEGEYVQLIEKLSMLKANIRHFAIGPFHPVKIKNNIIGKRHQCLEWLDKQEKSSVIYVSFGSTTSLTDDQIEELANGLERCGVKFIWVLRRADTINIFEAANEIRPPQLSEGYEDRVKDRGMVVRHWAPQLEILAHPSTGGFMSHCGWNSCMESISMGVAIAAWPMHSDQPRNAVLIGEVLKIGLVVRDWPHRSELVRSDTIENAVKALMVSDEGKKMKKRAADLGEAVRESVAESGVTSLERDSFISHITR